MRQQKVINDWVIATKETIAQLQSWLRLLETWQRGKTVINLPHSGRH